MLTENEELEIAEKGCKTLTEKQLIMEDKNESI
jgi:hypothetical protein